MNPEDTLEQNVDAEGANDAQEEQSNTEYTEQQNEAMTHGWKPLQEYLDEGGDPDLYSGAGAYLKAYKDRQKRNQYRDEVDSLKGSIDQLTNEFVNLKQRDQKKHLEELEAIKKKAKEELDMDAYDSAQDQIDKIKAIPEPEPQRAAPGEPEFVKKFRQSNPVIDEKSDDYDPFVNRLVETGVNEKLTLYRAQHYANPSEAQMQDWMEAELKTVQREMGQRRTRKPPAAKSPQSKGKSNAAPSTKKLDAAELSVYQQLLSANKNAAENFLKSMTEGR